MTKNKKITVQQIDIVVYEDNEQDYISLTDIARYKNPAEPKDVVKNWMRTRTTIEFLGLWEQLNNPNFKGVEFDSFLYEAGSNSFTLSPSKWIEATNAKGVVSRQGKNGGTFAHKDIAFEFASWVSAGFKLYLIKEFQRLKNDESSRNQLEWNLQRTLSKINYRIHTDAIKENLIPMEITKQQASFVYANEADLLNVALFGMTAKDWREQNPDKSGNIRDFASLEQLVVLSNMESINASLINKGISQSERLLELNKVAITQMKSLLKNKSIKKLK
ncbi:MAG: KilA-N domain-containing protein [Sphingobacteriales bacterium]|nr:MAG: KilA-N domain-containing protein [Sphingobacteriales bacterium]